MTGRANTFPRRRPLTFLVLFAAILLYAFSAASGDSVSSSESHHVVWLSGPAAMWSRVVKECDDLFLDIRLTIAEDFEFILSEEHEYGSVTLTVSALSATSEGPDGVGVLVSYTISTVSITESQVTDTLRRAARLPKMSALLQSFGFPTDTRVLPADGPQDLVSPLHDLWTPINGSAFAWDILVNGMSEPDRDLILAPLQIDLQNAVDAGQERYIARINETLVNATGMLLKYDVYCLPDFAAAVESGAEVPASAESLRMAVASSVLPGFNAARSTMLALLGISDVYSDLLGTPVTPKEPLWPNPSPSTDDPPVIIGNVSFTLIMHFGTSADRWDIVLNGDASRLKREIELAGEQGLDRNTHKSTVTVTDMRTVRSTSRRLDELRVTVEVGQSITNTSWKMRRVWNAKELASVMTHYVDYSAVYELYDAADVAGNGGGSRSEAVLLSISVLAKLGMTCTSACIGMVILGSLAGGFTLVTLVIGLLMLYCCFWKPTKEGGGGRASLDSSSSARLTFLSAAKESDPANNSRSTSGPTSGSLHATEVGGGGDGGVSTPTHTGRGRGVMLWVHSFLRGPEKEAKVENPPEATGSWKSSSASSSATTASDEDSAADGYPDFPSVPSSYDKEHQQQHQQQQQQEEFAYDVPSASGAATPSPTALERGSSALHGSYGGGSFPNPRNPSLPYHPAPPQALSTPRAYPSGYWSDNRSGSGAQYSQGSLPSMRPPQQHQNYMPPGPYPSESNEGSHSPYRQGNRTWSSGSLSRDPSFLRSRVVRFQGDDVSSTDSAR